MEIHCESRAYHCFGLGSFCCDKTPMTKANLREEKIYFSFHSHITVHHGRKSGWEPRTGTWWQKLRQKPWRKATYWLV